jgi:hypothetical protein
LSISTDLLRKSGGSSHQHHRQHRCQDHQLPHVSPYLLFTRGYLIVLRCRLFFSDHIDTQKSRSLERDFGTRSDERAVYFARSLAAADFCLALHYFWAARTSNFLLLSPVKAPPASFTLFLAMPIAPSALSCLLLLPDTSASWKVLPVYR